MTSGSAIARLRLPLGLLLVACLARAVLAGATSDSSVWGQVHLDADDDDDDVTSALCPLAAQPVTEASTFPGEAAYSPMEPDGDGWGQGRAPDGDGLMARFGAAPLKVMARVGAAPLKVVARVGAASLRAAARTGAGLLRRALTRVRSCGPPGSDWLFGATLAVPIALYVHLLLAWLQQWGLTFDHVDLRRAPFIDWLFWPAATFLFPLMPLLVWWTATLLVSRSNPYLSDYDAQSRTIGWLPPAAVVSFIAIAVLWGLLEPGPASSAFCHLFDVSVLAPLLTAAWTTALYWIWPRWDRRLPRDMAPVLVFFLIITMMVAPPVALLAQVAWQSQTAPARLRPEYPVEVRLSRSASPILIDGVRVGIAERRMTRSAGRMRLSLDVVGDAPAARSALTQAVLDLDEGGVGVVRGQCGARPCLRGNITFVGYQGVVRAFYEIDSERRSLATHDRLWWYCHPAQVEVGAAPAVRTVPSVGQLVSGRGSLAVLSRTWNEAVISAVFMNSALEDVAARCQTWFHRCLHECRGIPGHVSFGCTYTECVRRLDPDCRLLQF